MAHRIAAVLVVTAFVCADSPADAAKPSAVLKTRVEFDFVDAPLTDVAEFLSELTSAPIKLGPKVGKDTLITAKSGKKTTFRQSLAKMLRPHKLTFRVDKADTTITIVPR